MDVKSGCGYICILLVILVTLATEVLSKAVDSDKFFTKKCMCKVKADTGELLHNFEEIASYEWPETSCHHVHNRCRKECTNKLDLQGKMAVHATNGFHYCSAYGSVTPAGGLTIQAEWEAKGCPHHKKELSLKTNKLCCGHTTLPLRSDEVIKVFGWNPDCMAQTYVVAE